MAVYQLIAQAESAAHGVPVCLLYTSGAGKTPEQMIGIVSAMLKNGQDHILITRLSSEAADMISQVHPLHYHKDARVGIIGEMPKPTGKGKIVVATGGTSDIPVAEEAALTAEIHANEVVRL